MSWLAWINTLFFQWFFLRLFKNVEDDSSVSSWGFMGFIFPMTGWTFSPWKQFVPKPKWYFYFWKRSGSNPQ